MLYVFLIHILFVTIVNEKTGQDNIVTSFQWIPAGFLTSQPVWFHSEQKEGHMLKSMYHKSESCNLLTLQETVKEFNLSSSMIEKLSRECGAKLKIGRAARYRKDVLQKYIDSFAL